MSYGSDADVLFVHDPLGRRRRAARVRGGVRGRQRAAPAAGASRRRPAAADRRRPAARGPAGAAGPDASRRTPPTTSAGRRSGRRRRCCAQRPSRATPSSGKRFVALIDPLRYPAPVLTDAEIAEVRRIKARVDAERLPRGADPATHLKLGSGGSGRRRVDRPAAPDALRPRARGPADDTDSALRCGPPSRPTWCHALTRPSWPQRGGSASKIRNATMLVRGRPSDTLPREARDRVGVAFLCGYRPADGGRLIEDYRRVSRLASGAVERAFWH